MERQFDESLFAEEGSGGVSAEISTQIADLKAEGIKILAKHTTINLWTIAVQRGAEETALNALLDALEQAVAVSLADHRRGDFESATSFAKQGDAYLVKTGGHGWSADPRTLTRAAALAEMRQLVEFNYGDDWSSRGRLELLK